MSSLYKVCLGKFSDAKYFLWLDVGDDFPVITPPELLRGTSWEGALVAVGETKVSPPTRRHPLSLCLSLSLSL